MNNPCLCGCGKIPIWPGSEWWPGHYRKNRISLSCENCSKPFSVHPSSARTYNRRHCSMQCKSEAAVKRGNPHYYKENAWKIFERRCADCGYSEHPEIILIHHIDGDRRNGDMENLVPLCQNCHCLRHIAMRGGKFLPPSSRRHRRLNDSTS